MISATSPMINLLFGLTLQGSAIVVPPAQDSVTQYQTDFAVCYAIAQLKDSEPAIDRVDYPSDTLSIPDAKSYHGCHNYEFK